MIKIIIFLSITLTLLSSANVIRGSGASFPYSVYKKWIRSYHNENGVRIDYRKKGSAKGIQSVQNRTVDFAGTDKPLSPKVLKKYNLYQFPGIIGAIIVAYNLPGIHNLKLSRHALVAIVHGDIIFWDDPIIANANKNIKLPHKKLTFVHRADGSGTTYNFTYYLSKISKRWHKEFGAYKSLHWPGSHHIGGKTNSGVTALLKQTRYSVGYVDYSDAKNNDLSMAAIENREGNYIVPTLHTFQVAASQSSLKTKKDFYTIIADPLGKESYPIVTASFILLSAEKTLVNEQVIKFYNWSFTHGQEIAKSLGYVPIPSDLQEKILLYWRSKGIRY